MAKFLRLSLALLLFLTVAGSAAFFVLRRERVLQAEKSFERTPHAALYGEPRAGGLVECTLCPNRCVLDDGQYGRCRARKNIGGKLFSMVYGKIAAEHVDPIEKKPFFHVLPGTRAYSIATPGCNMRCLFCQNWEISQSFPDTVATEEISPEEAVERAARSGASSIAFTYSEPVIAYEYVLETARLAKARGLKTLMVSSGYIEAEPLRALLPFIDAYKVDLKAFRQEFYDRLTGGSLAPVLETLKTIRQSGTWLEIVTLLIPGQNDSEEEIRELARWIFENLGPDVPLHFSRFHPQFRLKNLPPTPVETVKRAREIALAEGLHYVYVGNISFPDGETTFCPGSKEKAIERLSYFVTANHLKEGQCPDGEKIPGLWK
ncbi:MAG: AmmeMemoRadiSam system radical SAM enzyme [Candidatus Omnitrophota bacterium]